MRGYRIVTKPVWINVVLTMAVLCMSLLTLPCLAESEAKDKAEAPAFETYWMVFLVAGDTQPEVEPDALKELQTGHRGHLRKMQEDGYSLLAGPFETDGDDPIRGIVLYRGDLELEKVQELASADPAVRAGLFKIETRKWWLPGGTISFPKASKP